MDFTDLDGKLVPTTYLGDAVYALYDGYGMWLRLNDHRNTIGQIYLEPFVLQNLVEFKKQCNQLREEYEGKESENLATTDNKQEG